MKKTILPKLFVGYLLFAIMGFVVISTLTYHLSHRFIIKNEAGKLYKEATLIASDYAVSYYNNTITLAEFQERLNALEHYLAAQIWIMGTTGDILVDSAQNAQTEPPAILAAAITRRVISTDGLKKNALAYTRRFPLITGSKATCLYTNLPSLWLLLTMVFYTSHTLRLLS